MSDLTHSQAAVSGSSFDPIAYLSASRWREVSLGLERITDLLARLGNPQNYFAAVHVAGTNGKGSTCAFLAQILQSAGYKTGLFTSPYITTFEERIQINRETISLNDLREVTLRVKHAADNMVLHPTEFELMCAVAFLYFAKKECDIAVIEVGLGGRLDSTNVLNPDQLQASVITPIALDHCDILGSTLADITQEKAGIIKSSVPVISAPQQPEAKQVIEEVARNLHAPAVFVNKPLSGTNHCFSYGSWDGLSICLEGKYQLSNAALAIETAQVLACQGWDIPSEAVRQGLERTYWPGRFEVVSRDPLVIIDGAHNEQGISSLLDSLVSYYPSCPILFMVGMLADKDYGAMIERLVSVGAGFVTVPVPNERTLSASVLADEIANALARREKTAQGKINAVCEDRVVHQGSVVYNGQVFVESAQSISEGVARALEMLPDKGVICACGSLYAVASFKQAFATHLQRREHPFFK